MKKISEFIEKIRKKGEKIYYLIDKIYFENGITLISLVVTIIVMLILAGVTLSLITGDNGILNKAEKAVEVSNNSSVKEEVELAVLEKITEYYENYDDSFATYPTPMDYVKEEFKPGNTNETSSGASLEYDESTVKFNYIKNGKITRIEIDENGIVDIYDKLSNKILPVNYGDYINYEIDLNDDGDTTNDWRIFYNDGENVFIIAADYLLNTKLPLETDLIAREANKYLVYWPTVDNLTKSGASDIDREVANKFMFSWLDYNSGSVNNNAKAAASLLDTEAWKIFATGKGGEMAIGGPTLEMTFDSWNSKGYRKLYYNSTSSVGYYFSTNLSDLEKTPTWCYVYDDVGAGDSLYITHDTWWNGVAGYRIASPAGYEGAERLGGFIASGIGCDSWKASCYAVRPLVCLKNSVIGVKDKKGKWIIDDIF